MFKIGDKVKLKQNLPLNKSFVEDTKPELTATVIDVISEYGKVKLNWHISNEEDRPYWLIDGCDWISARFKLVDQPENNNLYCNCNGPTKQISIFHEQINVCTLCKKEKK